MLPEYSAVRRLAQFGVSSGLQSYKKYCFVTVVQLTSATSLLHFLQASVVVTLQTQSPHLEEKRRHERQNSTPPVGACIE